MYIFKTKYKGLTKKFALFDLDYNFMCYCMQDPKTFTLFTFPQGRIKYARAQEGGPLGRGWDESINVNVQAARAQAARGGKKTYTVAILKEKLRKQGKAISGTKAELEKRLSQ